MFEAVACVKGLFEDNLTVCTLLESLAEGVVIHDVEGRILLVNQRALQMFGYAREEILGQPLGVLLPERFRQKHAGYADRYFANPHVRQMGQGMDLAGQRKDGSEFPVEIGISFLEVEMGTLGLAFITDITPRKEIEWALAERTAALDAFAHTVAHDINASLSLLVGYSQILLDMHREMSADELEQQLAKIAQNAQKMSNVVNELLLLASLRKEDVPLLPVDIALVVGEALKRLSHKVDECCAEIVLPDSFPTALGYAPWLEEVWLNYLSNALKYGGDPPRVTLGGRLRSDDQVEFWVADNGPGLTEEQQSRLFVAGQRLETMRARGHGLGLSIVQRIVGKLGGQVGVRSEVGQGSTFFFTLRTVESQPPD